MSAVLTEDDSTTVECTIINKTKKDIVTGEEYSLWVLKEKSFVEVPLLPEAGGFNLSSKDILSGDEYSFRAYIEKYYGKLEAGHYRIVKEYTDKEKDGKKDTDKERSQPAGRARLRNILSPFAREVISLAKLAGLLTDCAEGFSSGRAFSSVLNGRCSRHTKYSNGCCAGIAPASLFTRSARCRTPELRMELSRLS